MPPFAQKKQKRPLSCKTATSIHPVTVQRRKRTHTRVRWTQQSSASNRTSGYKRPDGNQMHNRFRADQITKFALKKKRHASQHNPTHQGNDREREKKLKCMRNACELEHSAIACDCMRTGTHGNCMRLR
jgi:hypothetical protein